MSNGCHLTKNGFACIGQPVEILGGAEGLRTPDLMTASHDSGKINPFGTTFSKALSRAHPATGLFSHVGWSRVKLGDFGTSW